MDRILLTDGATVLRSPADEDAPDIAAAVQRSLQRLAPWMPWAHDDYSIDDALAWARGEIEPGSHRFVVVEGDRIVGAAGLNRIDELNRSANLGYWLDVGATGRGHATRAAALLARHGLHDLGLQRIEVVMSIENEPSRRVAERAGAVLEGVRRHGLYLRGRPHDAHVYAFVAAG